MYVCFQGWLFGIGQTIDVLVPEKATYLTHSFTWLHVVLCIGLKNCGFFPYEVWHINWCPSAHAWVVMFVGLHGYSLLLQSPWFFAFYSLSVPNSAVFLAESYVWEWFINVSKGTGLYDFAFRLVVVFWWSLSVAKSSLFAEVEDYSYMWV